MLPIYVVLGHTDYEGDQLVDIFTDEGKALELAQQSAEYYDRVDVEKWGVAPGAESTVDRSYDKTFWRPRPAKKAS